eukprot:572139-Hanusia_phi.AAC.2
MAQELEYSPQRQAFALVHCELLYTLCDKVYRNPASLLPVVVNENVNTGGLGCEFLLLNWSIQHLQDAAGGEYAQRGILALLSVPDHRVTNAIVNHSALIERAVRMVDMGFQSAMKTIDSLAPGSMDEVGSRRKRPDPTPFYASLRFVDHVIKVADIQVANRLLDILDANFLRQTMQQRLIKGSEVQHVGVMELLRGLFEPDPMWIKQGRYGRRLQQPQLIGMIAHSILDVSSPRRLSSVEDTENANLRATEPDVRPCTCSLLQILVDRIDSMNEEESCAALELFLSLLELNDFWIIDALTGISKDKSCRTWYGSLRSDAYQATTRKFIEFLETLQQDIDAVSQESTPNANEASQEDSYRRDSIKLVSTCFQCCGEWETEAIAAHSHPAQVEDNQISIFLHAVLAKLSTFFANSWRVNLALSGIISHVLALPNFQLQSMLTGRDDTDEGIALNLTSVLNNLNNVSFCGKEREKM